MTRSNEDEIKRILREEFKKEEKSQKKLFLILGICIVAVVISATLFMTNVLGGVKYANNDQAGAVEFVPLDTETAQQPPEEIPDGQTVAPPNELPPPPPDTTPPPPTENVVCDYNTNPPTCTSV